MTDPSQEQQAEALIAKMKAARGYMYPEWEFAARQDPRVHEELARVVVTRPGPASREVDPALAT